MGKSTYEIRIAGAVPLDLLENFRQIETVEPAGTILHAVQMDDSGLWGLIDALREAGIELIEIRRSDAPAD
jgi:phage terminase large subunit-like protein